MSRGPSPSNGNGSESSLDPEKVRQLFANVMGLEQTLGDHLTTNDAIDDADVLKTMLGASAEELEPAPRPTGDYEDDAKDAGSSSGSPQIATGSGRGSSVKPSIAKARRVPPPSTLAASTTGRASVSKTGPRMIGAPSSKPIASAATTRDEEGSTPRNNPCDDSDGDDEVFQSSKYDSDGSDNEASSANKSTLSRSGKTTTSKRAPRRPRKKESDTEKTARILREREESKRARQLKKTQMRSSQLTRRHSALELLDGLIPLGLDKPKIGFARQHMAKHSMERLSQTATGLLGSNQATRTAADKKLDARVCAYLEKDPEDPRSARDLVFNKIDVMRKASNVPGALGVLEMRRALCDPAWLPVDDALHKRKGTSHGEGRKLDGAMRELAQEQGIDHTQATKRQTWLAAALAAAPK